MHLIRTAEELARLLQSPLDPELHAILAGHAQRLAAYPDYAFEELALIAIVEAGDRLADTSLLPVGAGGGRFSQLSEYVHYHPGWYEAVFILSDDGFGLVLLVQQGEGAEPELIAACEAEAG